tara:strand:- start:145 stop:1158 length:1014 start_codon:yes stop_codon:yes gene_type:complete
MKKLLLILISLPMIGFGQNVYIPDANFKACLLSNYDINTGGNFSEISFGEAAVFNGEIECNGMNISELTGIETFHSLTRLSVMSNQITSIDLSQNTTLEYLAINFNQITSIDLSQNVALNILICNDNQLTSLDVSHNTALEGLFCSDNQLISLDVSGCTALTGLFCSSNQLTSLDVSTNTGLTSLELRDNQLTGLDVSQNTALNRLDIHNNQIPSLDLNCPYLSRIIISSNQFTELDLRNSLGNPGVFSSFVDNPNLTCINVINPTYANLHLTVFSGVIDPQQYFSDNCSGTAIEEHTTNKEPLKVTDLLGRKTKQSNQPLFYLYDDGTVEKRIVIE